MHGSGVRLSKPVRVRYMFLGNRCRYGSGQLNINWLPIIGQRLLIGLNTSAGHQIISGSIYLHNIEVGPG